MSSQFTQSSPSEHVVSEKEAATGRAPFDNILLPSMSSEQYTNEIPDFEEERSSPQILTPQEKYKQMLKEKYYGSEDLETDRVQESNNAYKLVRRLFGKGLELRPRSYTSSCVKPNVCPEEF